MTLSNNKVGETLPKISVLGTRGIPALWGGIERKCEEIYSRLAKQGFSITIYIRANYTKQKISIYRGVRLIAIPTIQEKHLESFIHTFFCTLHACFSDAQILHFYAQGPCLFSWIPRILAPHKKVVFSCCGLDWKRNKWGRWAQRFIKIGEWLSAKATHARIAVSHSILNYYREKYGSEMWYIPNGTVPLCAPESTPHLAQFGLEPGKYFVFIGRLVPEKAVEEVIKAFHQARSQLQGLKLAIVGGTSSTDRYVSNLKELAADGDNIVFTSYVYGETLGNLYAHAFAYVTPSHLEGLPNALLEAISYGTPVIVSDIKPHLEIVHPPGNKPTPALSWVFKTGNVNQLSERLISFSKLDKFQRNAIGQVTKELVCSYYEWDHVANSHATFYRQWQNNSSKPDPLLNYAEQVCQNI